MSDSPAVVQEVSADNVKAHIAHITTEIPLPSRGLAERQADGRV